MTPRESDGVDALIHAMPTRLSRWGITLRVISYVGVTAAGLGSLWAVVYLATWLSRHLGGAQWLR